ncbi:hypothetical protein YC2023_082136 [Brassica napus]
MGSASTVLHWVHENLSKIDEKSLSFCSRRWLYCKEEQSFGYLAQGLISVCRLSPDEKIYEDACVYEQGFHDIYHSTAEDMSQAMNK